MTTKFSIGAALLFMSAQNVFGCPNIGPAALEGIIQNKINNPQIIMRFNNRNLENVRPFPHGAGNEQSVINAYQQNNLHVDRIDHVQHDPNNPNVCEYIVNSQILHAATNYRYQFTFTLGN